ncbi:protein phosphatase 2C domain-containing protein [Nonomuraea rhodomycinica]|uniref:Protein phosphatase 2C domain-containing protein n=1 Tax=Nonomuraea rhodomycinica TaxID=1712872 RepID=A0A7Y6IL79_9ACTN|nr:protein phosphatase 2C domain-containing protein [Nonomuraea rhodomycinica]NUW38964.1 protein phosphatase 2C domain-containing protein [Nonomuraea rhodomycinica]
MSYDRRGRPVLHVNHATTAAPGGANEDYLVTGPAWIAVLDGATAPRGVDSGCVHDVRWLVRTLAMAVAARIEEPWPLTRVLDEAIHATMRAHGGGCDLLNPDSPSATIAIVRRTGDHVDYLVLCDSPIAIRRRDGSVTVVADDRLDHLPGGHPYRLELIRSLRNQPDGFWVASTAPHAAAEALTGSVPVADVTGIGMFTDGVTRLVEWYGRSWEQVLDTLTERGPASLLADVREAELAYGPPRPAKVHDDATAAWILPIPAT